MNDDGNKSRATLRIESNSADFKSISTTTKFEISIYYFMVLLLLIMITFTISFG